MDFGLVSYQKPQVQGVEKSPVKLWNESGPLQKQSFCWNALSWKTYDKHSPITMGRWHLKKKKKTFPVKWPNEVTFSFQRGLQSCCVHVWLMHSSISCRLWKCTKPVTSLLIIIKCFNLNTVCPKYFISKIWGLYNVHPSLIVHTTKCCWIKM